MANSIFGQATYDSRQSLGKAGRVELLAQDVANELNTYKNFGVFASYNDVYAPQLEEKEGKWDVVEAAPGTKGRNPGTPAVRSIFNKYSAVLTGNSESGWIQAPQHELIKKLVRTASSWRLGNNTPLLDTPDNRDKLRKTSGCTVRELVQASQNGYFGSAPYSYADFMYCKYLNRIPNNYLITLRRFPVPVNDSIMPIGFMSDRLSDEGKVDGTVPVGTMVTWLGAPGNEMSRILKYEYNMPFKESTAQWEDVNYEGGGKDGILNQIDALVDPASRAAFMKGESSNRTAALDGFMGKFFNAGSGPYPQRSPHADKTKLYGPIDRVKKNFARSEEGLDTKHQFDLVFEYELKAYNGINPRQAMLDLIASILSVTYTTGGFWKGGYRGGGMRQGSIFSKMSVFKAHGSFTEMVDAFTNDLSNGAKAVKDSIGARQAQQGNGSDVDLTSFEGLKKAAKALLSQLNDIGGLLMGGLLNKLGRPARYSANSLISENPVGLWHITIGNPHHPIMSMGNMILTNTSIEHTGPLGMDDFPTGLKVTCSFTRGKPRDQYYLEALYMGGNDRIYHSMSGKIADMYSVAAQYRENPSAVANQGTPAAASGADKEISNSVTSGGGGADPQSQTTDQKSLSKELESIKSISTKKETQKLLQMYFGIVDPEAIIWSSEEQDTGAFKKTTPAEGGGEDNNNAAKSTENKDTQT